MPTHRMKAHTELSYTYLKEQTECTQAHKRRSPGDSFTPTSMSIRFETRVKIDPICPTPPLGQDMTQGHAQFNSLNSEFSFS